MLKDLQAITFFGLALLFAGNSRPRVPGRPIDLGSHKLHSAAWARSGHGCGSCRLTVAVIARPC